MIQTLEHTSTTDIAAALRKIEPGGTGRVLNLVCVIEDGDDVDQAIEITGAASREHPCRVVIVVENEDESQADLRADIHTGESPSEVVVLYPTGDTARQLDTLVMPLLLADTPIVTYWPNTPPKDPSEHPLGKLAIRRITDSRETEHPIETLRVLASNYVPGDTDLSWSGITLWRGLLAAIIAEYPNFPLARILVKGNCSHPSNYLIAEWLQHTLDVPVDIKDTDVATIQSVQFIASDDTTLTLYRENAQSVAELIRPDLPKTLVNLQRRSTQDCLMEDLRQLDSDELYGEIMTSGLIDRKPIRACEGELAGAPAQGETSHAGA
ncbi:MAG: glucose-6-phosphate dehydrogenase assembly protein OpcA [Actinomycetaceae bacterium]|nr:glucose-6-phosphate dehydrogenase assembly protein OpcA [Actinomycetaceae bacterium]